MENLTTSVIFYQLNLPHENDKLLKIDMIHKEAISEDQCTYSLCLSNISIIYGILLITDHKIYNIDQTK